MVTRDSTRDQVEMICIAKRWREEAGQRFCPGADLSFRETWALSKQQQVMQAEDACLARHLGDVVGGSVLRAEAWRRQGRAPLIMPGRLEAASGSCFG